MTRLICVVAALALGVVGCGDDDSMTMMDAGGGEDTGGGVDAGTDTGPVVDSGTDSGPVGCTEGCDFVEIVSGFDHSCARRENGEVLCWGGNQSGQLGDNRMSHDDCSNGGAFVVDCTSTPVPVAGVAGGTLEASSLRSHSGNNNCAMTETGPVCWGRGVVLPVGSDQPTRRYRPEAEEQFAGVDAVELTTANMCGLTGGVLTCLGDNSARQVADDDNEDYREVQTIAIDDVVEVATSAGGQFMCARTASDVLCFGSNQSGQLGDGTDTHTACGIDIDTIDCSGTPVSVAGDLDASTVTQLSLGTNFACALAAGSVWCWGDNGAGQMGNGESGAGPNVPTEVTAAGTDNMAISAGGQHVCAVKTDGSVICWGSHEEGQLGDGEDVGAHESCSTDTTFDCSTSPVDVVLPGPASLLAAGFRHTCALLDDGNVYCWGWNDRRQIGQDDREVRTTPVMIEGLD